MGTAPTGKEISKTFTWIRNGFIALVVFVGAVVSVVGWWNSWREHREAAEDARTRQLITEAITPYVSRFTVQIDAHDALIKFIMDNDTSWDTFADWKKRMECKDQLLRGDPCTRRK